MSEKIKLFPPDKKCPSFFAFWDHLKNNKSLQSHHLNGFGVFVLFRSVLDFLVKSTINWGQNAKTLADQWLGWYSLMQSTIMIMPSDEEYNFSGKKTRQGYDNATLKLGV